MESLLELPFKIIGPALLALVIYFVRESKDNLTKKLESLDSKIKSLEELLDQKTTYIIDKILSINPDKESILRTQKNQLDRLNYMDGKLVQLEDKISSIDNFYKKTILGIKEILIKYRTELNDLHSYAKEGNDGSGQEGGAKKSS